MRSSPWPRASTATCTPAIRVMSVRNPQVVDITRLCTRGLDILLKALGACFGFPLVPEVRKNQLVSLNLGWTLETSDSPRNVLESRLSNQRSSETISSGRSPRRTRPSADPPLAAKSNGSCIRSTTNQGPLGVVSLGSAVVIRRHELTQGRWAERALGLDEWVKT